MEINGEHFAKNVINKPVTVPCMGEAVLDVTAMIGFAGIVRQINTAPPVASTRSPTALKVAL